MNLEYIRSAIYAHTNIWLTIPEVTAYLLSENLATQSHIDRVTFKGYDRYYDRVATKEPVNIVKLADDLEGIR